ncbi:MAG: hypothetical protein NT010_00355 [Proteobacteria bacterium]|nr:hypothetical protein [Pseudomonadota bacterium]
MSGILQMWMGCEICRPQTYSMYVGGSQGEADRRRSISIARRSRPPQINIPEHADDRPREKN